MNDNTKKWHVVYTRPKWEKKVASQLSSKNIESYCPVNKVQRQWSDRKKVVVEPLFTSYVFVSIPESQQFSVRATDGIINFVYWLGKPAVIRTDEIDTIKQFLNDYINVQVNKTAVNLNDQVRIIGGPLMEQKGNIVSVKNKTVKVSLPSLGYMMHAEVETSNIEIINSAVVPNIALSYK